MERPRPTRRAAQTALVAGLVLGLSAGAMAPALAAEQPVPADPAPAADRGEEQKRTAHPELRGKRKVSAVRFLSKDGSADFGTATPFTLKEVGSSRRYTVAVPGQGGVTDTVQKVRPGKYKLTSDLSMYDGATYVVDELKPATGVVTVKRPTRKKPKRISKVVFSLDKQAPDLAMETTGTQADSVTLSWAGPEDVTEYVLRRTEGMAGAATQADGTSVPLESPTATTATDSTVTAGTEYTYTLFASRPTGAAAPVSVFAVTPTLDGTSAAYSLMPNSVMATDFDALGAKSLGGGQVSIVLSDAAARRVSETHVSVPAARSWERRSGGDCIVGQPVVVPTQVAGQDAFYGAVAECKGDRAVVDTKVPLDAAFKTLEANRDLSDDCEPLATAGAAPQEEMFRAEPEETSPRDCDEVEMDTDGDGLNDNQEKGLGTDPADPDTDADGHTDGQEVAAGTNPLDAADHPAPPDHSDADLDGLAASLETKEGLDPNKLDSDGDGFTDGEEVLIFLTDAADANSTPLATPEDTEPDGLDNAREQQEGSDPNLADTDGDLFFDGEEVLIWGTDPADAASKAGDRSAVVGAQPMMREVAPSRAANGMPKAVVNCEGTYGRGVRLNPYVQPGGHAHLGLSKGKLTWNIDATMTVGVNPEVYVEGNYECAVEFQGKSFQITWAPVPINLNIKPLLKASASAKFVLYGPNLSAKIGFHTDGHVEAKVDWCWYGPCGVYLDMRQNNWPIYGAEVSNPWVEIEGGLNLSLGTTAEIAVGYDGGIAGGAKAGFAVNLVPLSANFDAKWHNRFCTGFSLGADVGVNLLAEAWIVKRSWGVKYERELFKYRVEYPGMKLNLPRGCG